MMEEQTTSQEEKPFNYLVFGLGTVALAFLAYAFLATTLLLILGNSYLALSQALGQMVGMAGIAILLSTKAPMGSVFILRLTASVTPLQWLIAIVGAGSLQLFSHGLLSLVVSLMPVEAQELLIEILNQVEENYLKFLGGSTMGDYWRSIAVGALVPAVAEELLFRGILQRSMEERYSPFKAILLSSFIFSMLHFNVAGFFSIFMVGAFLGILAYYTGSIFIAIVGHFAFNFVAVNTIFLSGSEGAVTTMQDLMTWETALATSIIGGVMVGSMLYLLVSRTPFQASKKLSDNNDNIQ